LNNDNFDIYYSLDNYYSFDKLDYDIFTKMNEYEYDSQDLSFTQRQGRRPDRPGPPNRPGPPDRPSPPNRPGPPDDRPSPPNRPGPPDRPGPPNRPGPPDRPSPPNRPGPPDRPSPPDRPGPPDRPSPPDRPRPPRDRRPPRISPPNIIPRLPNGLAIPLRGTWDYDIQYRDLNRRRDRLSQFVNCLNNFTFIWLWDGSTFWFYPTYIDWRSVEGFVWRNGNWYYTILDINNIFFFNCI